MATKKTGFNKLPTKAKRAAFAAMEAEGKLGKKKAGKKKAGKKKAVLQKKGEYPRPIRTKGKAEFDPTGWSRWIPPEVRAKKKSR